MARPSYGIDRVDCIKKLPDADRALAMLEELKRHCEPILRARGWRVLRLYEICCCTAGGKNLGVGGFCCPRGDKATSQRIALRLRTPRTHELCDLDHAMRILIHELAHIVHGNHSASFYGLMEELATQYDKYRKTGLVLDEANMPIVGGQKVDGARHNPSMREARAAAVAAAEARAATSRLMGGGKLGGGGSWRDTTPAEMAARAAEGRQRQWDAEHGLDAAELEAMARSNEGSSDEDEVEVVVVAPDSSRSSIQAGHPRPSGYSAVSAQPAGTSSRSGDAGGSAGDSEGGETGAAPGLAIPSFGIQWGAEGTGRWQQAPCPVCGPVCDAILHDACHPPPQDTDEGGQRRDAIANCSSDGSENANAASRAGSGVGCGMAPATAAAVSGAAETPAASSSVAAPIVVDLTLSEDDEPAIAEAGAPTRAAPSLQPLAPAPPTNCGTAARLSKRPRSEVAAEGARGANLFDPPCMGIGPEPEPEP